MSSRESNIIDSEPSADDSLPSLFLILNGPVTTSSSVERARWDLAFKFMLPDVSSENSGDLSSPNRPSIVIDPETESGTASPTASISPVTTASPTTPTSPSGQLAELGISDPSSSTQCKVVEHDGGIEDYTTIAASFDGDIRAVSEGQIAQMSVTSDMQNVSQLYKMSLVWDQRLTRSKGLKKAGEKVPSQFDVLVDTGSNNSWVLGIEALQPSELMVHTYVHGHPGDPAVPPTRWPTHSYQSGNVGYINGTSAQLVMYAIPHHISLASSFDWTSGFRSLNAVEFPCDIAVARKVSTKLFRTDFDGIFGFGMSQVQHAFPNARTFMYCLHNSVRRPESSQGGYILYWRLRPPPVFTANPETWRKKAHRDAAPSWVAFNQWPCIRNGNEGKAEWTPLISISPTLHHGSLWMIRLLSMKFVHRVERNASTWLDKGTIQFEGSGLEVALDTGCSLSWVPEYVISALRHKIFPNPKTVVAPNTEEQGRRTKLTPDFTINSRLRHEIMNWHIVYTFWMGDEAPLKMMGPVDLFMCDRVSPPSSRASESVAWTRALLDEEDMDGLLYANLPKLKLGPNEAIFGVGFFQTMFVAMHKPSMDPDDCAVRLAPQWERDADKFRLPPRKRDDYKFND